MKFAKHVCAACIGLCLLSFSLPGDGSNESGTYYSLRFLKEASSPQQVSMMRFSKDNQKTVMVRGTLITYKNRQASTVSISGDFNNWTSVKMERGDHGVWYYLIESSDNDEKIRYKLCADGIWIADPLNVHKSDDGAGSYVSILRNTMKPEGTHLTYRIINKRKNIVEFRLHAPRASMVSLVGDFNNWNPENDMLKKDPDGIWRLKKRITDGKYKYNFIVDGKWRIDRYNPHTATNRIGQMCSVLRMK